MSIVLLIRSLNYGGAERQVVELAKGLHARGHFVLVAVSYDLGPLGAELPAAGISVAVLAKRGRWDVLAYLWRLARLVRRVRPQVLYSFLVEPNIQAAVLRPFVRGTRIVWGVRASNMYVRQYGWFPSLTLRLSRYFARCADVIIANSQAGAQYHSAKGYSARKMTVVPNGIDLVRFRPDSDARRRARTAWSIPESSTLVGTVGRLDPMKDYWTLLEAAVQVIDKEPDTFFVCVGDGPEGYRRELEARASSLRVSHRVIWAGAQGDMTAVYNAFDVCCLSSAFGEGFSNALGEAMACGVPCVATDVGDAASIIDSCGVIVPPGNAAQLAEGILQILATATADRKQACRRRIEEQFSVELMVNRTERILRAQVDALP